MNIQFIRDCVYESRRKGHKCGSFTRPCIHHDSCHCLACCVRQRFEKQ